MALLDSSISRDRGISSLSPEAAVLFFLILPNLNNHGKMDGDAFFIKGKCCRHIKYINVKNIPGLLQEISRSTSVKWWEDSNGDAWIHAVKFSDYNKNLRADRMGEDRLPSYNNELNKDNSGTTPGELRDHSIPEVEGEEEEEGEEYSPFFSLWWKNYPRKTKKFDAYRAWKKARLDSRLQEMIDVVDRHKQTEEWKREGGKFIPHGASWINGKRWEDETEPEPPEEVYGEKMYFGGA